jgi:hypothetical protein
MKYVKLNAEDMEEGIVLRSVPKRKQKGRSRKLKNESSGKRGGGKVSKNRGSTIAQEQVYNAIRDRLKAVMEVEEAIEDYGKKYRTDFEFTSMQKKNMKLIKKESTALFFLYNLINDEG